MEHIKLAILDLYDGTPNQGMRCIKEIVEQFSDQITYKVFDLRGKAEVPDIEEYNIYIGTGGPGSPFEGNGLWDKAYFQLMDDLWHHNQSREDKKFVFFICHSFQMACRHFKVGKVSQRRSKSFGTFPVHKTEFGKREWLFENLPNPFWIADFRDWQVTHPDYERLAELGAKVLLREKIRPHVPLERAIMGIRFSSEIMAVQFHPEADPEGMIVHFQEEKQRSHIFDNHGEDKYETMMEDLKAPNKIPLTHDTVLPLFIKNAVESLQRNLVI